MPLTFIDDGAQKYRDAFLFLVKASVIGYTRVRYYIHHTLTPTHCTKRLATMCT